MIGVQWFLQATLRSLAHKDMPTPPSLSPSILGWASPQRTIELSLSDSNRYGVSKATGSQ